MVVVLHGVVSLTLHEVVHVGLAHVDLTSVLLKARDKVLVEGSAWLGLLLLNVVLLLLLSVLLGSSLLLLLFFLIWFVFILRC